MAPSSSPALPLLLLLAAAAALTFGPQPTLAVDPVSTYCSKNFTGAQTQASISEVLAALVPRASATYYATATFGTGSSTIWGLAQCRGDIPSSDCALCIGAAARQVASSCRGQADARVWYDYCFLRYDDADFLGLPDTGYTLILINTMNATGDLAAFDRAERELMARVAEEAGDSASAGLARETARFGSEGTAIYGLGWCTKDITAADCGLCVAQAVAELPNYCRFRRGCRVLYSSCMARYETYPFFFPVTGADDDADASSAHAGEDSTRGPLPDVARLLRRPAASSPDAAQRSASPTPPSAPPPQRRTEGPPRSRIDAVQGRGIGRRLGASSREGRRRRPVMAAGRRTAAPRAAAAAQPVAARWRKAE